MTRGWGRQRPRPFKLAFRNRGCRGFQNRRSDAEGETLSHNRGARKVHSENLYQLVTYVMNVPSLNMAWAADGVLVYPRVTEKLREEYSILGRKFSVFTVDLAAPWQSIDREIRELFR